MTYDEVRPKIKTGDMLLWRASNKGTLRTLIERWIVKHGTASVYTHVGVAWVEHNRVWVMEMTTKGCAPRLLSSCGDFDWAPAPKELSEEALQYAFECFGHWEYSRLQAVLGALKRLGIGNDNYGQCAEFSLATWSIDNMAPTNVATPGACADGAAINWGSPTYYIKNDATRIRP